MRESTKESPIDRGQVELIGQCQVCGALGPTVAAPGLPEPNQLCERCAVEYGEMTAADEEELAP